MAAPTGHLLSLPLAVGCCTEYQSGCSLHLQEMFPSNQDASCFDDNLFHLTKISFHHFFQVCPILDDEDGHLSYKLGDVIEHDNQRCEYSCPVAQKQAQIFFLVSTFKGIVSRDEYFFEGL